MRSAPRDPAVEERLLALRRREAQVILRPSAEAYVDLAESYQSLGLEKESDRLLQAAESLELNSRPHPGLLCGTANPTMIIEVIQIVTRTTLKGELTIETPADTFHLFFDEGRIINASCQSQPSGLASFRMALRVTSGNYRFVEKTVDKVIRLIDDPTETLLLNAMHDADSESASTAML